MSDTQMWELLEAGSIVTLVGIGVVFALLTLLVGVIQSMSLLSRVLDGASAAPAAAPPPAVDDEVVGVIGAAIRMYRRDHGRE